MSSYCPASHVAFAYRFSLCYPFHLRLEDHYKNGLACCNIPSKICALSTTVQNLTSCKSPSSHLELCSRFSPHRLRPTATPTVNKVVLIPTTMNIRVDIQAEPKSSGVNVRLLFRNLPSNVLIFSKATDTITLERRNVLPALIAAGFPIVCNLFLLRRGVKINLLSWSQGTLSVIPSTTSTSANFFSNIDLVV